jgi:SAM-dependent MidA family methyltransferase
MNALEAELREMIATEGPISVERYMRLCLQHPRHGYYTTREAIGRGGDFITAPEVDQMFGELVGLWAAEMWMGMGAPHALRLVELGPGRGTLMADALRATRVVPGFHEAIWVDLVETSPRLAAEQRARLDGAARHLAWYETIDALPDGPAIVIANEFFDALPVRHYWRGPSGWHERLVGLGADGGLVFGAAREPIGIAAPPATPGQLLEIGHAANEVVARLASRIAAAGGAMLVLDYGHGTTSLGETLQAMRDHAYADVLRDPGEADLTAHVDFAALTRAAESAGAAAHGPVAQGVFLERLGIAARAARLKRGADAAQAARIDTAVARFTAPESSMATLFKVLVVTPKGAPPPPGFEEAV